VEILNFDSLGHLKSCGERTHGSNAYTLLSKTGKTFIWVSHRPQYGRGVKR